VAVASGDDLVEEIRSLLVERQVAKFVADQERGFRVDLELANQ